MAITLSDNIDLPAPKPLRTTELVGFGLPASVYTNKEAIPEYHRHMFMETIDPSGQKWVLKNPLDIMEWSPIPTIMEGPTADGSFVRVKLQNYEDWQPLPAIIPEPNNDGDWVRRVTAGVGTWSAASAGGGGGTWGSITGTLSDQTDLQNELDGKVDDSQVQTDVPLGALFTDTIYDDTAIQGVVAINTLKVSDVAHPLVETAVPLNALFTDTLYDDTAIQTEVSANTLKVSDVAHPLVESAVPVGAVFTDTQIDPQEGLGISIDKTDPMAPIFTSDVSIVDKTYAELKALATSDSLVGGQIYKITDFKTQWAMDIYDVSASAWFYSGSDASTTKYAFDTAIEPLIVRALSGSILAEQAVSETFPEHVIKYDPDWNWTETSDGPGFVAPTGTITFRKNNKTLGDYKGGISAGFDYIGYRVTRFAVTANAWSATKSYDRKYPVSVPDPLDPTNKAKDGLFISLKGGNLDNDPADAANDGEWWMTFRPIGEAAPGTVAEYRDFVAPDWQDANQINKDPYAATNATNAYGFMVDPDRHMNFVTYGFLSDLQNGVVNPTGKGTGTYEVYEYCHIENKGNMFLATKNEANYYANYYIDLGKLVWGLTAVTDYFYQTQIDRTWGGLGKLYIIGASWGIMLTDISHWVYNNYFTGFAFISSFGGFSSTNNFQNNIAMVKGAARDNTSVRCINSVKISGNNNLFYSGGWMHLVEDVHLEACTILGSISHNRKVYLRNSVVGKTAVIKNSSLSSNGFYSTGTNIINKNIEINGTVDGCNLTNLSNVTIDGSLIDVKGAEWFGVTIPSTVTLKEVNFSIPKWYGKNVWGAGPTDITGVVVSRKYSDVAGAPTVEKLWYDTIDVAGAQTSVELV